MIGQNYPFVLKLLFDDYVVYIVACDYAWYLEHKVTVRCHFDIK